MLATTDSRELAEWLAFYSIEPWGDERADLRSGIVASLIANSHRKKGARAMRPADFMPYTEEQKMETPEQQQAYLAMLAGVARKGKPRQRSNH